MASVAEFIQCDSRNYTAGRQGNRIRKIVVHYTGTEASAHNNLLYFSRSSAGASAHYFIDKDGTLRQLVSDMDLGYLSGYYRIGDYSAVSASLRYFSLGEVGYSSSGDGKYDMTINPYEMSFDVAYSLMLSEKFSLAAAVRWIYSDLTYDYSKETTPGSAFAADIAAYY